MPQEVLTKQLRIIKVRATLSSAIAQLVEQKTVNLLVAGSSPARGAISLPALPLHPREISRFRCENIW